MRIETKFKIWKALFGVAVATMLVSGTAMVGSIFTVSDCDYKDLALAMREAVYCDNAVYLANFKSESDALYYKLVKGEITTSEFKTEYDRLLSDEYVEEYARNSQDEEIQAFITDYDEGYAQFESERQLQDMRVGGTSLLFVSGGMLGAFSALSIDIYRKKMEKNTNHSSKIIDNIIENEMESM